MVDLVSIQSYSQTAVNEIQLVDRGAILHIDVAKKTLELELIYYHEHSVPINSAEGVAIMDRWVEFWGNFSRGLCHRL